jgi:hypothetical protein
MARIALHLRHKTSAGAFLVTALAHLHVRDLARRNCHVANDNTFSYGCS